MYLKQSLLANKLFFFFFLNTFEQSCTLSQVALVNNIVFNNVSSPMLCVGMGYFKSWLVLFTEIYVSISSPPYGCSILRPSLSTLYIIQTKNCAWDNTFEISKSLQQKHNFHVFFKIDFSTSYTIQCISQMEFLQVLRTFLNSESSSCHHLKNLSLYQECSITFLAEIFTTHQPLDHVSQSNVLVYHRIFHT